MIVGHRVLLPAYLGFLYGTLPVLHPCRSGRNHSIQSSKTPTDTSVVLDRVGLDQVGTQVEDLKPNTFFVVSVFPSVTYMTRNMIEWRK